MTEETTNSAPNPNQDGVIEVPGGSITISYSAKTAKLSAYNLGSFAFGIQKLVQDGYEIEVSNESYPTGSVGYYQAGFKKIKVSKAK